MKLIDELRRLVEAFDANGIEYALCGGLAMAVYDLPRATLDIDILIKPEDMERARQAAGEVGFTLPASAMEFKGGKVRIQRVSKVDPTSHELISLDLLIVTDALREIWTTRQTTDWDNGKLAIVSPRGLIALKSLRDSGQDRQDIDHLKGIADEN